jgi:WhiB family redox-sensing transcriptional regulator
VLHPIEAPRDASSSSLTGQLSAGRQASGTSNAGSYGDDTPWHAGAACRRDEAGLFFAPSKEPTAARLAREEAAKRVCARCPVLLACREHALALPEPYGVWGGLTAAERRVVIARRRRRERELREAQRAVAQSRIAAAG